MITLLLALALGTSAARAGVPEGTYAVDCVDSEVSLTFSIRDAREPARAIFQDRAVVDTGCRGKLESKRAEMFRLVMRDVCQAVGVRDDSCHDLLRDTLEPLDGVVGGPLQTLSVAAFGEPADHLAELRVAGLELPASIGDDGRFEAREDVLAPELAGGDLLVCHSTGDVAVRGTVTPGAPVATVEVDQGRTYICSAGVEHVLLQLEVRAVQRGGAIEPEVAAAE